jgi:hypothetical protein
VPGLSDHEDVLDVIERVTIAAKEIEIQLSDAVVVDGQDRTLTIPWISPSPYQRREIVQGEGEPRSPIRPMRVQARAVVPNPYATPVAGWTNWFLIVARPSSPSPPARGRASAQSA